MKGSDWGMWQKSCALIPYTGYQIATCLSRHDQSHFKQDCQKAGWMLRSKCTYFLPQWIPWDEYTLLPLVLVPINGKQATGFWHTRPSVYLGQVAQTTLWHSAGFLYTVRWKLKVLKNPVCLLCNTWCVQVLRSPKRAFAAAMQSWRERCEKCVCLQGDYVEKWLHFQLPVVSIFFLNK